MFAIIVTEKGGEQRRLDFDKAEVTIGRVQGNDVILPKGNVSKRHARIVLKDDNAVLRVRSIAGGPADARGFLLAQVREKWNRLQGEIRRHSRRFVLGNFEGPAKISPWPVGCQSVAAAVQLPASPGASYISRP